MAYPYLHHSLWAVKFAEFALGPANRAVNPNIPYWHGVDPMPRQPGKERKFCQICLKGSWIQRSLNNRNWCFKARNGIKLIFCPRSNLLIYIDYKQIFHRKITCTIAGEENPNISKPSMLPGGCKGGRSFLPSLCCLAISWFTLSLTISQHLLAERWMNTSLGLCSNDTWGRKR